MLLCEEPADVEEEHSAVIGEAWGLSDDEDDGDEEEEDNEASDSDGDEPETNGGGENADEKELRCDLCEATPAQERVIPR